MGLFSSIASIFSGGQQAKAAKQASAAQAAAAQKGIDAITGQQAATTANLQPWVTSGQEAVGAQSNLLGLNGNDPQDAAIKALQDSPLYKSLFSNGQNTVLANGSATGGLRGGNIQNSLAHFGSDTLAQVIQQQLQNLGGVSGQGAQTGAALGQLGANASSGIADLFTNQGAAQAGGIMGKLQGHLAQTAGINSAVDDVGNAILTMMGMPSGGGSSGGSSGSSALASQAIKAFI